MGWDVTGLATFIVSKGVKVTDNSFYIWQQPAAYIVVYFVDEARYLDLLCLSLVMLKLYS